MHRLQAVGVELRLLLAHRRVDGGLLRLHHRQRLAVVSPEDIVGIADARLVWHARHFVFTVLLPVQRPAGAFQIEIDDERAGLVLVPVVGIGETSSFSALMAARRSRNASSSLSISLRASAAASRWAFRASSSWTLAGVGAGSTFGTMDSSKVLPLQTFRALAQVGAARPVEDVI